jgi:DNA-binding transcriptional ArsR family regulator
LLQSVKAVEVNSSGVPKLGLQSRKRSNTLRLVQVLTMVKGSTVARKRKRKMHGTVTADSPLDKILAKALSHPMRAEILSFLTEHGASSPTQMNKAGLGRTPSLGETDEASKLSNISYHCRVLEELGCIELVKTRPRRGSTEHFYRGVTRMLLDVEAWAKLPKEAKNGISIAALKETIERASTALQNDTFDSRNERNVINLGVPLDEQAFKEASQKMHDLIEYFDQLRVECIERADNPDELIPTSVSLLMYESPRKKSTNG